jgi:hypothetical protein
MTGAAIMRMIVPGSRPISSHVHSQREPVSVVGVARHEAKRPLLPAAADEDARPAGLDRAGPVERGVDPVEAPLERRPLLGEHPSADRERLVQAVHPLADPREVEAVALVLRLVPGRPDPQDRPAARDDVQRGHGLGEKRRVAVGDAGDQRPQPDA